METKSQQIDKSSSEKKQDSKNYSEKEIEIINRIKESTGIIDIFFDSNKEKWRARIANVCIDNQDCEKIEEIENFIFFDPTVGYRAMCSLFAQLSQKLIEEIESLKTQIKDIKK